MRCVECHQFQCLLPPDPFRHKANPDVLQKSSEDGCELCKIVFHRLSHYYQVLRGYQLRSAETKGQQTPNDITGTPPNKQVWLRINYSNGETKTDPYQSLPDGYTEVTDDLIPDTLEVTLGDEAERDQWVEIELKSQFSDKLQGFLDSTNTQNDLGTGSDQAFRQAGYWLQECIQNHPDCQSIQDTPGPLPLRVLDIGSEEPSDPFRLCLGQDRKEHYIALSYCWGQTDVSKTTEANLEDRLQGIDVDLLPQTYQDCVVVARKFGIKYIWIDALCIIQDSFSDWTAESAKMARYYRNALLTVSANGSDCADGGLFHERNSFWVCPFLLTSRRSQSTCAQIGNTISMDSHDTRSDKSAVLEVCENGAIDVSIDQNQSLTLDRSSTSDDQIKTYTSVSNVRSVSSSGIYIIQTRYNEKENIQYSGDDIFRPLGPWDHRAWTLQERMLSSRVLSYGGHMLHWECQEAEASERMPEDLHLTRIEHQDDWREDKFAYVVPLRTQLSFPLAEHSTTRIDDQNFLLSSWHRAIEDYFERKITNESDRLPALYGLMDQMAESLGSKVFAGIREVYLWYDILWTAHLTTDDLSASRSLSTKPSTGLHRTPTWSCIATRYPVIYRHTRSPYRPVQQLLTFWGIDVLKSQVTYVDATLLATGQVRAQYVTTQRAEPTISGWLHTETPGLRPVPQLVNGSFYWQHQEGSIDQDTVSNKEVERRWSGHWYPDQPSHMSMQSRLIWFLAVARQEDYLDRKILFLALEPIVVEHCVIKQFRRIGLCEMLESEISVLLDFGELELQIR